MTRVSRTSLVGYPVRRLTNNRAISLPSRGRLTILNQVDPSRTLTLRNQFVREFRRRFRSLISDIREAIVDQDVLGLLPNPVHNVSGLQDRGFEFLTTQEKIEAFVEWLAAKNEEYLLSGGTTGLRVAGRITRSRDSWMNVYIDSAYQRGIRRARTELKARGITDYGEAGWEPDTIAAAFNRPIHADRVGAVYSRAYTSLKAITTEMESTVADVLAIGMAEGRHPRELAKALVKAVSGKGEDFGILDSLGRKIPAQRRAEILARTEVMRAHHSANMGEYRAAGVMGIQIQVEYLTAGDARVCPRCEPLNGRIYTLDEAENLLPRHPQCRCVALPYIPED